MDCYGRPYPREQWDNPTPTDSAGNPEYVILKCTLPKAVECATCGKLLRAGRTVLDTGHAVFCTRRCFNTYTRDA